MDQTEIEKLVERYAALVIKEFRAEMVVLFGSYAKGKAHKHSDIDVAVVVEHVEGNYLEKCTRLFQLTRKVNVLIEPVLIAKDEYRGGFLEEILKTGKVIYRRDSASA